MNIPFFLRRFGAYRRSRGRRVEICLGVAKPKRCQTQSEALSWQRGSGSRILERGELNVVVTVSAGKIIVNCQRCM
jgi:hypothetical protein